MEKFGVALGLVALTAVAGCEQTAEVSEPVRRAAQALELAPGFVLGFESSSFWHGVGVIGTSLLHTEGAQSLSVLPLNYSTYKSDAFAFKGRLREVVLDLQQPALAAALPWKGAVQLYLDCAERSILNRYLGQVELTPRPVGTFTDLHFTVPALLGSQLAGGCSAMKVSLSLNVPGAPGPYLLDNLRLRTDLVLHYSAEALTTAGQLTDSSGYDRHGTLVGAAGLTPAGRSGSGLALDGASGYVTVPNDLLGSVSEVTVATWVRLNSERYWSRIFDFGGTGFAYLTPNTSDGFIRYSAYAGFGIEGTVTAPSLPAGVWKHVALTTKGRDYRLYIDGVEAGNALTIPTTPADVGAGAGNWLGRSRFPDPLLQGTLDDFRVYDRVLSQPEIAQLAAPGNDYALYRFDETQGARASDSSSLGLSGDVLGAQGWQAGVIGGALGLDGTSGHVRLPAGVVQACSDFTLGAWLKLRQNSAWNRIFDFGNSDASRFMYLSPAGFGAAGQELRFGLITPLGVHDVGYPYVAPLEEWTHLGVVLRDQTVTLFVNGRAAQRQAGVVSNPSDLGVTLENTFGKSKFPDPTFAGALDDVRFSCRAFDDRELRSLAHLPAPAALPNQLALSGDIRDVHDPAISFADGTYRLFSTGPGVMTRTSTDLRTWTFTGSVFPANPSWITDTFGPLDSLWAPDISNFGGTNHLYYAASSFGSNRSCIGHATKASLASADAWVDQGPVLCSNVTTSGDDFNAIDPNVAFDANGTPWLSFGSFWDGIKMVRLNAAGNREGSALVDLARGPGTAAEAPFIIYRAPYYYLFASYDLCCRGVDSTYRVVVGRSTSITGPYLDKTGQRMLDAGGVPVVSGNSRFRGPGHNAILGVGGQLLNVYHSYDALAGGTPTLRISELVWQEGWPVSAEP